MSDLEKAKKIVREFVAPYIADGHMSCPYSDTCGDAMRAIEEALKEERQKTARECAEIANRFNCFALSSAENAIEAKHWGDATKGRIAQAIKSKFNLEDK